MLILDANILPATFAALRGCGGGERECVVYWVGPTHRPGLVDRVVQPRHDATPLNYDIDPEWLTPFYLDLRAWKATVRAQIHTHPGARVEHSPTDDAFALAPTPGFVSVVLPDFAMGAITLDGAYATTITDDGWTDAAPTELIRCL